MVHYLCCGSWLVEEVSVRVLLWRGGEGAGEVVGGGLGEVGRDRSESCERGWDRVLVVEGYDRLYIGVLA